MSCGTACSELSSAGVEQGARGDGDDYVAQGRALELDRIAQVAQAHAVTVGGGCECVAERAIREAFLEELIAFEALRQAGVPVGKVYTSKFNRAYETAVIAGFKDIEKTVDLTEGGLIVSPNENNRRSDAFRKMLAVVPADHTNTILITHQPNIVAAFGKDWFDVKEGETSIFRPADGGYKLIARVQMDEWPRIATVASK